MKSALCLALIFAAANTFAQQPPQAPKAALTQNAQQAPKTPENNKQRPSLAPPMAAPPQAAQSGSAERTEELLRAQTAAIKSLATKLDSLEERIGRMERRLP